MICKLWDLIGIPFPYTDLTTKKRHPVLVITSPDQRGDFMGLAVTTAMKEKRAIPIEQDSPAKRQIIRASISIRGNK